MMHVPTTFFRRIKWAIYTWIGDISVRELAGNQRLGEKIEALCKTLRTIPIT